jgi:hypothetical protein
MKKTLITCIIVTILASGLLFGCTSQEKGALEFRANGEDFVRQGFVSKDGWDIFFDHVYITLSDITAYQTDPPYDPHTDGDEVDGKATVSLEGSHTLDLAEGGEDADPIFVGQVASAPAGQYNAIHFRISQASGGDYPGYSLVMIGTAEKGEETVDFTIKVENEFPFTCGEYVGDERKGLLEKEGTADLEMTFHFDHIFGDFESPVDDALNLSAVGFDPFAALAEAGKLDADMAALESRMDSEAYQLLVDTLPTLGHVGEGHCHYAGEDGH